MSIDDYMFIREAAQRSVKSVSTIKTRISPAPSHGSFNKYIRERNLLMKQGLLKCYPPLNEDVRARDWLIHKDAMVKWFGDSWEKR